MTDIGPDATEPRPASDPRRDRARMKAILVLCATIAFAAAPFVSPGFGGFDPGRFPYPVTDAPITPAGWAFGIWGPIYVWLLVHAAWGLFRRADDRNWDRTRWPLFFSLAIGASWIAVAAYFPRFATLQLIVMSLLALAALFLARPRPDRWLLLGPIALYGGWLTAASCVAMATVLQGHGILGPTAAAIAMLLLAAAIAFAVQWTIVRAPEYGAGVAWALVGVIAGNIPGGSWLVAILAALGIAALVPAVRRAIG